MVRALKRPDQGKKIVVEKRKETTVTCAPTQWSPFFAWLAPSHYRFGGISGMLEENIFIENGF